MRTLFDPDRSDGESPDGVPDTNGVAVVEFVQRLQSVYRSGRLGGTVHEVYPSVAPDSRDNYLYFTLVPILNYQRKSEHLWRSALRTYEDRQSRFVFYPENLSARRSGYRDALCRYGLALQPERHTWIWLTVSETLARDFNCDPRSLLEANGFDVVRIRSYVTGRKKAFPYLSGPKLLNYWLYMLSCFTPLSLVNRDAISVVPDSHVTRATLHLGLGTASELKGPKDVERLWREVLTGTGIAPCDVHAPLWRWSRAGFPRLADLEGGA